MSFPLFRFTLSNTIAGSLVISEPGGWDSAILKLERNEEFHSLVEYYDQPLTFYGQDGAENGGYDYITAIVNSQGPDVQIRILVETSYPEGGGTLANDTFGVIYDGLLDIASIKIIDFYKLECGLIRNDFWQKFINRKATPVDLSSTTDLDGGTRVAVNPFTLNLPSQKLRQRYYAYQVDPITYVQPQNNEYLQVDLDTVEIDEISERFTMPSIANASLPVWSFAITEAGSYTFDFRIEASWVYYTMSGVGPWPACSINQFVEYSSSKIPYFWIQINDESAQGFTDTPTNLIASTRSDVYTYSATRTLNVGDVIRIFGLMSATLGAANNIWIYGTNQAGTIEYPDPILFAGCSFTTGVPLSVNIAPPSGASIPTYFNITADTTYVDTTTEAFTIGNAAKSILSKIASKDNALKSSGYIETECGGSYAVTKGLNIRGYTLSEKPFWMSFQDFWNGINPILNLGLGYSSDDTIEILEKEDFYNPTTLINLDYVNHIEQSFKQELIFKSIQVGYEKWEAESNSGIDDPQTKRTYNTRFKTIGTDFKAFSKFIAASLAIEQTRRNRKEKGKDWRLDEDVIIIALNKNDTTQPELTGPFTTITNLLNYTTRYNIRLSASRIFQRWNSFFSGCLSWSLTDVFLFGGGEGNFDMTSGLNEDDCESEDYSPTFTLSESQDLDPVTGIFSPIVYTFEHELTFDEYKVIRNNSKNAIGLSRTGSNHIPCHILSLEYQITHGKAKFTVLSADSSIRGGGGGGLGGETWTLSLYSSFIDFAYQSSGNIYWRKNGGAWALAATVSSLSCSNVLNVIGLVSGDIITFAVEKSDGTSISYYGKDNSTSCTTAGATALGDNRNSECGSGQLSITMTGANRDCSIYIQGVECV